MNLAVNKEQKQTMVDISLKGGGIWCSVMHALSFGFSRGQLGTERDGEVQERVE